MADDIVQKIIVQAEDQASPTLNKIGQDAQQSFSQLQRAAQQAGLSVEQFGKLSANTQQQYLNMAEGMKAGGVSGVMLEAGAAAKVLGTGLDEVVAKTGVTRKEMQAFAQVLREFGLGQLGQLGSILQRVGSALGELGVAAVAVGAAGGVLVKFAFSAAEVAEQLSRLSDITGEPIEKLSALQQVFAKSGVSASEFAKTFGHIAEEIAQASEHMATDIEASSQRVAQALQHEAAAALGVEQAQLSLAQAVLNYRKIAYGEYYPELEQITARERALLAVKRAQLAVEEARLAQAKAIHDRQVAEANDLEKIIELYRRLAAGGQVTFDALTTAATKHTALLKVLAEAGQDWMFVLADILKNATELERRNIAKALHLTDDELDRLKRGGDELRRIADEVKRLGLNLTEAETHDLAELRAAWRELIGILDAVADKLGALFGPTVTAAIKAFTNDVNTLVLVFQDLHKTIDDLNNLDVGKAAWADLAKLGESVIKNWNILLEKFSNLWPTVLQDFAKFGESVIANWNILIDKLGAGIDWLITKLRQLLGLQRQAPAPAAQGAPDAGGLPMASGGLVWGKGGIDANLAWLTSGEYVIRAAAVRAIGLRALDAINAGVPRFASGGLNMGPRLATVSATAAGSSQRTLHLTIEGRSFSGLSIPENTAASLERFAVHSQIASTGRKQSWRR